jgi:hemoglobin
MSEGTLYERLGGVFRIAEIVNDFSDQLIENPLVGQTSKNPRLQAWHAERLDRLPGLKFLRTLWVCALAGGPFDFIATRPGQTEFGLEEAHRELQIAPEEFDEVAAELGRTLDRFEVPSQEKGEVLAGFFAHKHEVTTGYRAGVVAGN